MAEIRQTVGGFRLRIPLPRRRLLCLLALTASAVTVSGCDSISALFSLDDRLERVITAKDGQLRDGESRFRFVGVNVYSLASHPETSGKFFCGRGFDDVQLEELFREVQGMGGNVIRMSAYQSFTAGGTDYSRFDAIFRLVHKYGIRLVLTLENQWHNCTEGGYKYAEWYKNGFRRPYGGYRLSYVEHVRQFVSRYRNEPAILMWQLMNEAESQNKSYIEDPYSLIGFATEMARVIKAIDARHPVCLGTSGIDRPGSGGLWYAVLTAAPGIDIVEAHDYGNPRQPWPIEINGSWRAARQVNQPFFIGEVGLQSPPFSKEERAKLTRQKLEAAWKHDVDGVLIWSYRAGDGTHRDFDAADPLYQAVRQFTQNNLTPKK